VATVKKTTGKEKKPLIKTKVKPDKAIEVEIQKSPSKTVAGKVTIILIVVGMTVLMLVSLILLIIEIAGKL
jgi:hypothetical protein